MSVDEKKGRKDEDVRRNHSLFILGEVLANLHHYSGACNNLVQCLQNNNEVMFPRLHAWNTPEGKQLWPPRRWSQAGPEPQWRKLNPGIRTRSSIAVERLYVPCLKLVGILGRQVHQRQTSTWVDGRVPLGWERWTLVLSAKSAKSGPD